MISKMLLLGFLILISWVHITGVSFEPRKSTVAFLALLSVLVIREGLDEIRKELEK